MTETKAFARPLYCNQLFDRTRTTRGRKEREDHCSTDEVYHTEAEFANKGPTAATTRVRAIIRVTEAAA